MTVYLLLSDSQRLSVGSPAGDLLSWQCTEKPRDACPGPWDCECIGNIHGHIDR